MALLTAGYWQTTYWADSYYTDDFWQDYGVPVITGGQGLIVDEM